MAQLKYKELREFYLHLAEAYDAGISMSDALIEAPEWVGQTHKIAMSKLEMFVRQGKPLADAMREAKVFPYFDVELVAAAEKSGRVGALSRRLSERYEYREELKSDVIKKLGYPLFLVVSALFLFQFGDYFAGKITTSEYLLRTFGVLAFAYVIVYSIVTYYLGVSRNPEKQKQLYFVIGKIPIVGELLRLLALDDYFFSLAMMLESGVPIVDASYDSAKGSHNWGVKRAAKNFHESLRQGVPLSKAYGDEKFFPKGTTQYVRTGEATGNVAKMFNDISKKVSRSALGRLEMISKLAPKIIYGLVLFFIVYRILDGFLNSPLMKMNIE